MGPGQCKNARPRASLNPPGVCRIPKPGTRAVPILLSQPLVEAYGQATQPEAGLSVLAQALTLVTTTGVRWWEAELYRLQGALLLQLPNSDVAQVEACFQQALAVARGQQAKS